MVYPDKRGRSRAGGSVALRYGLVLVLVTTALILTQWPALHLQEAPLSLFLFAVIFSARVGGVAPGLLATALCTLAFDYYFLPPIHSLAVKPEEIPRLIVFALALLFVGLLAAAQRSATESLKRARDDLRQVLDTTPTLIHSARPDGYLDYFNQRWLSYVGLSLENLQGWGWTKVIHHEDLEGTVEKWRASLANREPFVHEARMRRADGEYRWQLFRMVPLHDLQGNIVKWYGSAIDIEDRKRAEEALRASERGQRRIAEQLERERVRLVEAQRVANIGSWEVELQSLNVIWSEQTHSIFETDPSRFQPTRPQFREFIHPEDRARVDAAFTASLDKTSPCTVEYRIVMPDGRVKFLEERWQTFHDEQGRPVRVGGTCLDITEHARAEEELQRLYGKLLHSQDEERRRIARELHDSTGQNLVALAMKLGQLGSSAASIKRKANRLLSECKELVEECIREVRTLSYVMHPPMLEVGGLEVAIREYLGGFSKRSGIQVELEMPPRLGRMARDVELALFRVVQESLTNIQRHSGSQQAKIRIHRNSNLLLEISDHGHGVFVAGPTGNEKPRYNLGVGIPSMHERVKMIGGRLQIDSTSYGTTVRVTIPLAGNARETTSNSHS